MPYFRKVVGERCYLSPIDPADAQAFTAWLRGVVAVDGKTLRRSFDRAAEQGPIHMISAWSSQQRLVLGQCKVANKSNEITAIPELLQLLELHGAVVTIERTRAQIIDQNADYVFGLKGNDAEVAAGVTFTRRVVNVEQERDGLVRLAAEPYNFAIVALDGRARAGQLR